VAVKPFTVNCPDVNTISRAVPHRENGGKNTRLRLSVRVKKNGAQKKATRRDKRRYTGAQFKKGDV